ncbi:hypothetical protein O6H91_06G136100 [Diphasiastrum complanatum]|uniref:Uncharacterized protein n=1 Tax=Diphasiastrum complanatum TaxID=34168 RepID=A0ACC2DJU1_DIPCM|nr:hypothetical protein O6H91_06G136100 [Diphasiastrum complanatum]
MGIGPSSRRHSRTQQPAPEDSPRRPIPPSYPASHSGLPFTPYSPNGHPLRYLYPPNHSGAVPSAAGRQFYPSNYMPSNGQYLISVPQGFRPLMPPPVSTQSALPQTPAVAEHQKANTIKNDVNLKKASLRLEKDEANPGHHLVAFSFDATLPGSLTPVKPDAFRPVQVAFEKGLGQRFRQAVGTGVNLSLFDEDELLKEGEHEIYALVVRTETVPRDLPPDAPSRSNEPLGAPLPKWVHCQTTHAVIERKEGEYCVRVAKQIIWVDGIRYELQEIYGIENSTSNGGIDGNDSGKECVICMSEPRDTTVLPCRHMCMCSECAKVLRIQTNRCPICRCVVERLLEIKVPRNEANQLRNKIESTSYDPLYKDSTQAGG